MLSEGNNTGNKNFASCIAYEYSRASKEKQRAYRGFFHIKKKISSLISGRNLKCEFSVCVEEEDGWEWYIPFEIDAEKLKSICINWENYLQCGRIIDLDVFDRNHKRISREDLGNTPRTCIVCGNDYMLCRRMKSHSLGVIRRHFENILKVVLCTEVS